jgi:hypothetical protein
VPRRATIFGSFLKKNNPVVLIERISTPHLLKPRRANVVGQCLKRGMQKRQTSAKAHEEKINNKNLCIKRLE